MSSLEQVNSGLHLVIDATNIRKGGGITHLSQLLKAGDPIAAGISRVTILANQATSDFLPNQPWLDKVTLGWMNAPFPKRMFFQQFRLPHIIKKFGGNVLFSPGGTLPAWSSVPVVTMSQNMLPFEPKEALRFGRWSLMRLKLGLLRRTQGRSFERADGLIFLTRYAEKVVKRALNGVSCPTALIPHGIEERFSQQLLPQRLPEEYDEANPFKILYVSILMPYKHQVEVAHAACQLRGEGLPIQVRFVGESWGDYGRKFGSLLEDLDPRHEFLMWSGAEAFEKLHELYQRADTFVFASSCENLPNILIEAMAAGLPIACSDRGPMPEVLSDAGIYFDPEVSSSIAGSLRRLASDYSLRLSLAASAHRRSQAFSWERCAQDTFNFIFQVANKNG